VTYPSEHKTVDEARAAGYVDDLAIFAKKAVRTGARHPQFDMSLGHMLEEPAPTQKAPPPVCTVDGVQVVELAVMFKPVALLVTTEHGVHELTRCYFQKGKFAFGVDMTRIGGIGVTGVEYKTDRGLQLHLDHGYELFIPAGHCQATWRLAQPSA
jgi:hypothetical protein